MQLEVGAAQVVAACGEMKRVRRFGEEGFVVVFQQPGQSELRQAVAAATPSGESICRPSWAAVAHFGQQTMTSSRFRRDAVNLAPRLEVAYVHAALDVVVDINWVKLVDVGDAEHRGHVLEPPLAAQELRPGLLPLPHVGHGPDPEPPEAHSELGVTHVHESAVLDPR